MKENQENPGFAHDCEKGHLAMLIDDSTAKGDFHCDGMGAESNTGGYLCNGEKCKIYDSLLVTMRKVRESREKTLIYT